VRRLHPREHLDAGRGHLRLVRRRSPHAHLERAVTVRVGPGGTAVGCEHRKGFLPRVLGPVGTAILGPRPIGTY
jgi:hypothetical protein